MGKIILATVLPGCRLNASRQVSKEPPLINPVKGRKVIKVIDETEPRNSEGKVKNTFR